MNAEAIEKIVEISQPEILEHEGKAYSTGGLHNLPLPEEPGFPTILLFTLDSLIDYVNSTREIAAESKSDCVILAGATVAALLGGPEGEHRRRATFASVTANASARQLAEYKTIEDFRIMLLTGFRDTPDRETILSLISKVTDEYVATSSDNGVSQMVTIKSGIATHTEVKVPSPIQLAPIRTFIEVEQPTGHFLFRLKQVKDQLPTAALFEIPTNWQREAGLNVKKYLDGKTGDVRVLA